MLMLAFLMVAASAQSFIRFEAEDAHATGLFAQGQSLIQGFSGSGYTKFPAQDSKFRLIFTVNIANDDNYAVSLRYSSRASINFRFVANGHVANLSVLDQIAESSHETWKSHKNVVELRQGLNSVVVDVDNVDRDLLIDSLDVYGAIPLAARGATLPYVEYEAEDATFNGVVIGPNRTYMSLPSEASGRKAVQLKQTGQYVEFVLKAPANAINVRFSIPDSSDGKGRTGSLTIQVDGAKAIDLPVTSKYSWAYGSYPFSKDPGAGAAHHFYDETRGLFSSTLSAGTKVRVVSGTSDTYTIDLVDFYVVPAPYKMPSGFLSVTDYGADASGTKNSTAAFMSAIKDATTKSQGLWIPVGTFLVSTRFTIDKMVVRGAGPWYSIVRGTVNHGVGFFGNWAPNPSKDIELYDFAMSGDTNVRDDSAVDSGVGGALDGNCMIQNVWIEHTKCGMWLDGPFTGLHILGTTIRNTYADGVNLHIGISNVVIEQCTLRNLGDDGLAIWSQTTTDAHNVFKFNTIQVPVLANGIAFYGGDTNSATDNYIADTICEGAGIQAGNRFTAVPISGITTFARNTIVRCGSTNRYNYNHYGSFWFWSEQAGMDTPIVVTDTEILDSSFSGIYFLGSDTTNISFKNVTINVAATYAMEVLGTGGGASFTDVVATKLGKGGIQSCNPGFVFNKISGCSGWDDVHCGN